MNYIDIILFIPLIWMAYRGFRHGFIIELASLVGFIGGIYAAIHYTGKVEALLISFLDMESKYLPVIAFVLVFIAVVVLVYLLGKILENFINLIALGLVNKIVGGIFGILKAALFISIVILVLNHINISLVSEDKKDKSLLYEPIAELAPMLWKKFGNTEFTEPGKGEQEDDKGLTEEV
jgi:membrane protein required for colicin V production